MWQSDQQDDKDQYDRHEEIIQQDSTHQSYYCCPDPSCKRTFMRSYNPDRLLTLGNHVYDAEKQSGDDMAFKICFEQTDLSKTSQEKLYDVSRS